MIRIVSIAISVALITAGSVRAEDVTILAKDYSACYNIAFNPIGVYDDWLVGLDYPGEYTEYAFSVDGFGTDRAEMVVMGTLGVSFHVEMRLTAVSSGKVQHADFEFIGAGFTG